jgi:cyclophilin family peptidyl-prolyl cis-trans isomerase
MNRISWPAGLTVVVTLLLMVPSAGADEASPASADAAAQAKAAFDQQFNAYRDALRQVERLRNDYQTADDAARAKINAELEQRLDVMQTLVDRMVAAAVDAYRLAPNAHAEITDLLVAVARYDVVGREVQHPYNQIVGGDRYEQALPIIKLLVDGGADRRELPDWGFLCAVATNDYDLAKTYLDMAQQSGALTDRTLYSGPAGESLQRLVMEYAGSLDEEREKWTKESAIRAAEAKADDLPRVRLSTTKGDITLELFENEAPQTVANFLTLVKQGFYNGLAFHRVIPGFMAQGGDPSGDGTGGPGYTIHDECGQPNARMHFRGSLSMAHTAQPDSGGSQFFITFVPTPHLDGKHTVFGRVIDGMDVVVELQRREPRGNPAYDASLPKPDRIIKAVVLRDRGHDYTFERLPAAQ